MTGISHSLIGASLSFAIISQFTTDPPRLFFATLVGTTAAILPDIDAPNSVLQVFVHKNNSKLTNNLISYKDRRSIIGGLIYSIMATIEMLSRLALVSLFELVKTFSKHRGFTHQILGFSLFTLSFYLLTTLFEISNLYVLAFAIGYITHLMGDLMTISGLTLFAPFSSKKFYLLPAHARFSAASLSVSEVLIVMLFLLFAFTLVIIF